jgi:hypothetical protein
MLGFMAALSSELNNGESLFAQIISGGVSKALIVFVIVTVASFAPAIRQVGARRAKCNGCRAVHWLLLRPTCGPQPCRQHPSRRAAPHAPTHPRQPTPSPCPQPITMEKVFGKDKAPASLGPFNANAELINGRAAMLGLMAMLFLEGASTNAFFM